MNHFQSARLMLEFIAKRARVLAAKRLEIAECREDRAGLAVIEARRQDLRDTLDHMQWHVALWLESGKMSRPEAHQIWLECQSILPATPPDPN